MHKIIKIFSLVLFILLAERLQLRAESKHTDKIKIGISVPLTGAASSYGTDVKNGLIFANEKIAQNSYELIIEDDQCSDKEAVNIAHKLVNVDQVKYVLGFGCSGTVLSSAPVYERAKVVVIASGTGAPLISQAGDYIFRTKPSLEVAGKKLAEDMQAKFNKVAVLTEQTAYCQGLTAGLVKANQGSTLEIMNEDFLPQTSDFRTILFRLKSKGAQALFINTQTEDGLITVFKQLKSINWNVPVYGTFHPGSQAFLKSFGKNADGIIFADVPFNADILNPEGIKIYEEYIEKYGAPLSGEHFVTFSYLAFDALHQALQSKEDVKNFLYQNNFQGIFGDYKFDQNGDILSQNITYGLKVIKAGLVSRYK